MPQNLIRLKQLNETEISGYIESIVTPKVSNLNLDTSNITNIQYDYYNAQGSITNKFINIFDVNSGANAILPNIEDKKTFLIKNIGSGILLISGNSRIDGYSNLILGSGESTQVLGVKNSTFTGWLTINTNQGII